MSETGVVMNVLAASGLPGSSEYDIERHASSEVYRNPRTVSQAISSLPIMASDYELPETLLACLIKNSRFVRFLQNSASYWPKGESLADRGYQSFFVFVRAILSLGAAYSLALVGDASYYHKNVGVFLWATTFLDYASVLPGQYLNQQRLQQPGRMLDATVLDESLTITRVFAILSGCTILISLISVICDSTALDLLLETAVSSEAILLTFLTSQAFIVMYLSFNLLFLLLDLKVSILLIDQLILLAENKSLTMEMFDMVRQDIHRRVRVSKFTSDLIIVPCMASVVAIAVVIFFLDLQTGTSAVFIGVALVFLLMKELFFVAIAFWFVAQVNGRADALTVLLSRSIWQPSGEFASMLDLQRVSMHASSVSEPISFTLLFKRVSYENVAVGAGSLVLTILVGVLEEITGYK
jgi:hypothetical protein